MAHTASDATAVDPKPADATAASPVEHAPKAKALVKSVAKAAKKTAAKVAKSVAKPAAKPVAKPQVGKAATTVKKVEPAKRADPPRAEGAVAVKPMAPVAPLDGKASRPKTASTAKVGKVKPPKRVHEKFTFLREDVDLIRALKARARDFRHPAKKSEIVRAAIHALAAVNDVALRAKLEALTPLKPVATKKKR